MAQKETLVTDKQAKVFGSDYIKELIRALKAAGKDSSGKLIKSLDPKVKDDAKAVDIVINGESYLKQIDEGRKAGNYPPIKDIAKWAKIKGIPEEAVFPIARSIYKFGIKPTNILSKVEKTVMNGPAFGKLEEGIAGNVETIIADQINNPTK